MPLYHANPRLKITDPGTKIQIGQYTTTKEWYWYAGGGNGSHGNFKTEAAALKAARKALGFQ